MNTTNILSRTISAAAVLICGGLTAHAATFVNTADGSGELFVGIHATSGQGIGVSVLVDLGAISTLSNALTGSVFTGGGANLATNWNIGANLATQFGNTWYDRPDLLWSAVSAVGATIPTTSTDFTNTLYGSVASSNVFPLGTTPYNRTTSNTQNGIAGKIINNMANASVGNGGFANAATGATSNIAVELATGDPNSYASWMPDGANATGLGNTPFGGFGSPTAANFEQAFAPGSISLGVEGSLDVYRMYRTTPSGGVTDPDTGLNSGPGSYQFTLTINQSGNITATVLPVPEPASIGLLFTGGMCFLGFRRRRLSAGTKAVSVA